jgi:hypothetical protein
MDISDEMQEGLGIALNEASLVGLELDLPQKAGGVAFGVLALPEDGPRPTDSRVLFVLQPFGRIAASLRLGNSENGRLEAVPLTIEELPDVVSSFGQRPIYGWEFVDYAEEDFAKWSDRLSMDFHGGGEGMAHSITLFQEGFDKDLKLCIWFDEFTIFDPMRNEIGVDEFIAAGRRWWRAFRQNDPRTRNTVVTPSVIIPLATN